ncbi:hypothetical protein, partial [Salmonella enterica]|uniref:hypothetical protein n=1 Tax=Salmonella enterica TaxID=28901 RepID=UPI001FF07AD5
FDFTSCSGATVWLRNGLRVSEGHFFMARQKIFNGLTGLTNVLKMVANLMSLSDHQCSSDLRGAPSGDHNTNVPAI